MRGLGELEAVVMQQLWDRDEHVTVRDVLDKLDRQPPLAYTTVLTVMDNLHRKGLLSRSRDGRAFRYWPTKPRAEFTADLMDELLRDSGDRSAALLRFVDRMTPREAEDLRQALGD